MRRLAAVPVEGGYDLYAVSINPQEAYGEKFGHFKTGGDYSPIELTDLDLLLDVIEEMIEEMVKEKEENDAKLSDKPTSH